MDKLPASVPILLQVCWSPWWKGATVCFAWCILDVQLFVHKWVGFVLIPFSIILFIDEVTQSALEKILLLQIKRTTPLQRNTMCFLGKLPKRWAKLTVFLLSCLLLVSAILIIC